MTRSSVLFGLLLLLAAPAAAQEAPAGPAPMPPSSPAGAPAAPSLAVAPAPPPPAAEAPSTGTVLLVLGSLGLAGGVGNLATSPLCLSTAIRSTAHTPCLGLSLGIGGAFLAAGVPVVVVGARQREAFLKWTPTVAPVKSGALVGWTGTW